MSVGLLLITHENIAVHFLNTARLILDTCPLATQSLEIPLDHSTEDAFMQAQQLVRELDSGNGVLVLTDIYGATPSNIGKRLCEHYPCRLVAGLNLPMLIRVLNYPQLNLENMALKALSGAHDGILLCECETDE